ncbi:xanthine dehydrogenase family protein molybdopterin-binding subunit [Niveispirillum irakense]|uniref:xanthine dehydrogenase family protein molybdopterin-binding subunit n=1 Tax=Niveispirillum irakense TaxID=34011 RepID=UPI000425ECCB|nr:xanthine dehydrogenase family protein molybdopterin-binding subunit [Niveispirillum irakense]
MKFDKAAGPNPTDAKKIIGQPHDRLDGPLKVAGRARYAYEFHDEAPNAAYGFILGAGIAKGRITALDVAAAEKAPGVLLVMTHENAPKQRFKPGESSPQLHNPEIYHYDQAIAFVVAETFEQARAAARLIRVDYSREVGSYDLDKARATATVPTHYNGDNSDTAVGDLDAALASAPVTLEVEYRTPSQSHAMMEPHATMALWEGDRLTVYTAHQMLHWAKRDIANTLGIPQSRVRVVSNYVGGGFGSKLVGYGDLTLSALAARQLGRPVKVALTRAQIFNHTSQRSATIQRIRLGAGRDGRLTAIAHEDWSGNLPPERAGNTGAPSENACFQTRLLYAGANRMTATRQARLDLAPGYAMRAPGEAVGLLALENAMDEMAEKLGLDPVEFRILNDIQHDPEVGPERPFSNRRLVECLRLGAERFGWNRRNPKPGQMRDGDWLIGYGVASAIRDNLVTASHARVRLLPGGRLRVESAMTDIGTGSYTIMGQTAAEMLGLPLSAVEVRLGDTNFPEAAGSGGSWGANSATSGVYAACMALRAKLAARAGVNAEGVSFADGHLVSDGRRVPLADLAQDQEIQAEAGIEFGDLTKTFAQASFGAHFCEVGVDRYTAEVRVRRMLTVASCGRILNPKTARSQCLGGMTMGIGAALMEELVVDKRLGFFVNHDLAEYHVPVHADIPDLDVIFLEGDEDANSSPLKARGVGELGICGVGAAVTNAIYNATGVRVRDYPVTLDKLLEGMPIPTI